MTLHLPLKKEYRTSRTPKFLLDQCVASYSGTKPEYFFSDVMDELPIDSTDDEVLNHSIKSERIIVTKDYKFTLKILFQLIDVIFQTRDNKRFYFKPTKSHLISAKNTNTIQKILDKINVKKISYIAETDYLSTRLQDYDVSSPITKLSNLKSVSIDTRLELILEYTRKNKSIFVTSNPYSWIKALFKLEECVFVDHELNLNYISVKYYEFDTVRFDKRRLALKNSQNKHSDILQENIRLLRNNIDEICSNLNFIESELLRRKELEIKELQAHTSHIPTKVKSDYFE